MIFAPVGISTRTVFKSIPAPHVRISKDKRLRMQPRAKRNGDSAQHQDAKRKRDSAQHQENSQPSIRNDTTLRSNGSSIARPHTDRRSAAALFRSNGPFDENGVSGCRIILRWTISPSAEPLRKG